jgi:hypothetical protein
MSDYKSLREEILKLIDHPHEEWRITGLSAEQCFKYLDKYEAEGRPSPKMFVQDDGVTLTWIVGEWKIYQHFISDGSGNEFYCFWNKKVNTSI